MGAPAIFEKQIEIKLLHPASTLESRIQVFTRIQLQQVLLTSLHHANQSAQVPKGNPAPTYHNQSRTISYRKNKLWHCNGGLHGQAL
jgi:hypothetical protein